MTNKFLLAFALGFVAVAPAFAQDAQSSATAAADARWTPYLGCWRIVQESVGAEVVPVARGLQVCARPSGRAGVEITTTVDGKNVLEQTVIADGTPQPITQ